jgi:hypothetical protein
MSRRFGKQPRRLVVDKYDSDHLDPKLEDTTFIAHLGHALFADSVLGLTHWFKY